EFQLPSVRKRLAGAMGKQAWENRTRVLRNFFCDRQRVVDADFSTSSKTAASATTQMDHLGPRAIGPSVWISLFDSLRIEPGNHAVDGNRSLRTSNSYPVFVWLFDHSISFDGRRRDHAPKLRARDGQHCGGGDLHGGAAWSRRPGEVYLGDRGSEFLEDSRDCRCRYADSGDAFRAHQEPAPGVGRPMVLW